MTAMPRSLTKGQRREYRQGVLFVLPFMLLFLVFVLLPVVISVVLSFTSYNIIQPPSFAGLDNYKQLFLDDDVFQTCVRNTLLFAFIAGPVGLAASFILAWVINQMKLRSLFAIAFYAPSITSGIAMSTVWLYIFSPNRYGLVNNLLIQLGFINTPILWNQDARYLLGVIILILLWASLSTSFLAFIAGFQTIDASLYEAAAVDGIRTRWQELWYITLPCIKPQLMFSAIMSITSSFTIGDQITMLVGFPSPNYAAHTIMHHLQDYGSTRFEMGYACAIATVLFLLMVVCNTLIQKFLRKVGN